MVNCAYIYLSPMKMKIDIDKFIAIRDALQVERAALEARLNVIAKALGESTATATPTPTPAATTGKRVISAATKAKMRASQQARWANKRKPSAMTAVKPAAAPKKKGKLSAQGLANIKAAQKARWAKVHAAKAAKAK